MSCRSRSLSVVICFGLLAIIAGRATAFDIVKAGQPVATIVASAQPASKDAPVKRGKKNTDADTPRDAGDEGMAVHLLQEWVKKITDADLPTAQQPPKSGPAIYVGKAAIAAGLKLDDIDSPSHEGLRIVVDGDRILIAGQSEAATTKAVCRFLEALGCRYFMDSPLGEVYPRTKDLSIAATKITEKPGLLYRNPKGPSWRGSAELWKLWNGAGGTPFAHSHSWASYIPKGLFQQHPEYFAMDADGQRKNGEWFCTSNPGLRELVAQEMIAKIKAGDKNPSISPTDGRGYCQCPQCKAQDDPKAIEPSSGTVSVTNRYVDFFDAVARRVAKECPEARISFYCYADYTQPPTTDRKLSPNLNAVIAPIRYCRLHEIGHADCPSRVQQLEMVDGWAKCASHLGYYNYMYDLADGTLPMFKYTACKTEFPYLASKGLEFMTIEVLSNWYIYGPQIYLSLRLAYDPQADAAALMEDYWQKFYGPAAGPMKQYWMTLDKAMGELHSHAGGFYGLAEMYTPERIMELRSYLDRAAEAAKSDRVYAERVAMTAAGLQNANDYQHLCELMAKGDIAGARAVFDQMTARIDGLVAKHYANGEYGTAYLRRFLAKTLAGAEAAVDAPNKLVKALPDRWRFRADDAEVGLTNGFASAEFDDKAWREIATNSATLSGQGIKSDTVLWYRTKFIAPKTDNLALAFLEVDGGTDVYVNGKHVTATSLTLAPHKKAGKGRGKARAKGAAKADAAQSAAAQPAPARPAVADQGEPNVDSAPEKPKVAGDAADGAPEPPRRRAPFTVDLAGVVHEGENVVAVRVDNRKINELFLGGILRPVLLIERPVP